MFEKYLMMYRLKNNLTQTEIAEKLGTSQSYYNQLENGKRKPGFSMINRIAKLLDLEPSFVRSLL